MKEVKEIKLGSGNHNPAHVSDNFKNIIPIEMKLCCDSRGPDCNYCVKITIDTEFLAFKQCFCGWNFRKTK